MKAPKLSVLDDAEAELSRARLNLEDIDARVRRGDLDVTQDDHDAAVKLLAWCELRLEGAQVAEAKAVKAAAVKDAGRHLTELRDGRHLERAKRIVDLATAAHAALEALYVEAVDYDVDAGRHVSALGRAPHLPDGVDVDRDLRNRAAAVHYDGATWQRTPTLAADLVAAVGTDLGRGADHQPAAIEPVWAILRAAHPALPVATPELDRRRQERQAERRRERERLTPAPVLEARDIVAHAHALAKSGDHVGVNQLVRSRAWPPGVPSPIGDTLDIPPAPSDAPTPLGAGRPRPPKTRRPVDNLPPAA